MLWFALLGAALSQDVTIDRAFSDAPPFDDVKFEIATCDGVRAQVFDTQDPSRKKAEEVFVDITNTSDKTCLYQGVILKGSLEGTYHSTQHRPGSGEGFFVAPGRTLRLMITPTHPELPRTRIRLEIAPGKATILLRGDAALPAK